MFNPRIQARYSVATPAVPAPLRVLDETGTGGADFNSWQPVMLFKTLAPEADGLLSRIRIINTSEAPIEIRVMKSDTVDLAGDMGVSPQVPPTYNLSGVITQQGSDVSCVASSFKEFTVAPDKAYWRIDARRLDTYAGEKMAFAILEIVSEDDEFRRFVEAQS